MSFPFRFSTLLALRERQRDQAAADVAQAHDQLREIEARRQAIALARTSVRNALREMRRGIISAQTLQSHNEYLAALQREDDVLVDRQTRLTSGLEAARDDLIVKHQAVAQLEKLYQREQMRYQAGVHRAEQRDHDSLGTARWASVRR